MTAAGPIVVLADLVDGMASEATLECVEDARTLVDAGVAAAVHVWALGGPALDADALATVAGRHGADGLRLFAGGAWAAYSGDRWTDTVDAALDRDVPILWTPDTATAREVLPRLAVRRRLRLVTDVVRVRVVRGVLEALRNDHSGLRMARVRLSAPTLVAQKPGVRGLAGAHPRVAELLEAPTATLPEGPRDHTVGRMPADATTADLADADRIVAGGVGIGSAENVPRYLDALAERLGAAVGGTRVISDRGWIPHERYIGSTGKTVGPKLYVALGISGASQHVVGLTAAETIVAVNVDRTAPIFGLADLAVVGDVHAVVPALLDRLPGSSGEVS